MFKVSPDWVHQSLLNEVGRTPIYTRGYHYYLEDRVQLLSENSTRVKLQVWGTGWYFVDIMIGKLGLSFTCTCPYAEQGYFCKHMVASGLFTRDFLIKRGTNDWRGTVAGIVEALEKPQLSKWQKPYVLVFSLQKDYFSNWFLQPYTLPYRSLAETVRSETPSENGKAIVEFISHNPWVMNNSKVPRSLLGEDDCVNCHREVVAFANVLIHDLLNAPVQAAYLNSRRPISTYLDLIATIDIPVFLGDVNVPCKQHLLILPSDGEIKLDLIRLDNGLLLKTIVVYDPDQVLSWDDTPEFVSKNPPWLLNAPYLIKLRNEQPADVLEVLVQQKEVHIPGEEETDFFEQFLLPLADKMPLVGEQVMWDQITCEPTKRLYLIEDDGVLKVSLRFSYDDYEVVYDKDGINDRIFRKSDESWTLVRVNRDKTYEDHVYKRLSSSSTGLKHSTPHDPTDVLLLRARVDPVEFLMKNIPFLLMNGFEIYGEENLKNIRVNRSTPTISFNVKTGIDWFDVETVINFGEIAVSLPEIRKSLRKNLKYVKLADGSIGEIPAEWLKKYKHLFKIGEQTERGVRFSSHHLTLIDQLLSQGAVVETDMEFEKKRWTTQIVSGIENHPIPEGFKGELRPYQKAGFNWLYFLRNNRFGGCLADDMGLGKTIQVLALLESVCSSNVSQNKASLIVVPKSLLVNWQREAANFTPNLVVHLHFGSDRNRKQAEFDQYHIVLTTYGTMRRDVKMLREYLFQYIVLDESQMIKNPVAQVSKAARLLRGEHRLVLTGTPVENSSMELWSQFSFLNPGLLGNLDYFKKEYVVPIERSADVQSAEFLKKMVYPFILRRTKQQVAPELPPKVERIVYTDMEPAQRKLYLQTRDYFRGILMGLIEEHGLDQSRMKVLEGLLRLRQICDHPNLVDKKVKGASAKMDLLLTNLQTLYEEGHKVLIFSQFVQMLKLIRKELDNLKYRYAYLDGQTNDRQMQVDNFQLNPDISFFLISLKAGGVGLNLTAADYVIHVDPWWNPAVEMQATDRTHRIGQHKPVFVYRLIARDSVEEKILELQERKRNLVDQLITTEKHFFKTLSVDDIRVLFS